MKWKISTLVLVLVVCLLTLRIEGQETSRVILFNNVATSLPAETAQSITVQLWDAAIGGKLLFSEAHSVDVDANQRINFTFGTQTEGGLDPALFPSGSSRYVDVVLRAGGEDGVTVLPGGRITLFATAFAMSPGPEGPPGPRGEQGLPGPQGPPGAPGVVQSVNAGAGLVRTGTVQDPILGIANGGVGTAQIADGAVTAQKIAPGGVGTTQVADGAVTAEKIALPLHVIGDSAAPVLRSTSTAANGIGLLGEANTGTGAVGIRGAAFAGIGVYGQSNTGDGIAGFSSNRIGVRGDGPTGVHGQSPTPNGIGVRGVANVENGTGVFGSSTIGWGVRGTGFYGVQGESPLSNGTGVLGQAHNGDNAQGVRGVSETGFGVWGASERGIGVYGFTRMIGAAGVFEHSGGGNILIGRAQGANRFRVDGTGRGFFNGGTQMGGADFAESVEPTGDKSSYEPGDVLVIDTTAGRRVALSRHPYSTRVAGIYSTKPGVLATPYDMDDPRLAKEIPLAIVGIVPCKVSAENGPIEIGDLLVTSSTPGHAMKGTKRSRMLGAIVGKALEPLPSGTGVIQVLVTLQ